MAARRPANTVVGLETEERLLVEAAQKDPAKFGDLYEIHFERVYAFIARRVRDRDTVEDLTSEVFQKALASLGSYQVRGAPFAAWLFRIAANAMADQSKRAVVSVEIADTGEKRERGLMYRKHLDDNAGMLFIFPAPENAQFWMKNTQIPLDMIFADRSGRVIGIVANAKPYSESLLGGFMGTSYVLEVNGGFAASHAIVVGDRLDIH